MIILLSILVVAWLSW